MILTACTYPLSPQIAQNRKVIGGGHSIGQLWRHKQRQEVSEHRRKEDKEAGENMKEQIRVLMEFKTKEIGFASPVVEEASKPRPGLETPHIAAALWWLC